MFNLNIVKFISLLVVLYITLSLVSIAQFCISGIRAYFIFGLVLVIISIIASYWSLKNSSIISRISGAFLAVIISLFLLLFVAQQNNLHVMCW